MCCGEGHPCHTARCAEHTCGHTAQFYPSEPSRSGCSSLWNDCSFTIVFAFLSLLWKPDGIFIAQQRWPRSHVHRGFLNRTSFLDELHHSLRQGSGGSASPTPSAQEGAWCCLSALSPGGTWDREQLTQSLRSPAWGQICHGLEGCHCLPNELGFYKVVGTLGTQGHGMMVLAMSSSPFVPSQGRQGEGRAHCLLILLLRTSSSLSPLHSQPPGLWDSSLLKTEESASQGPFAVILLAALCGPILPTSLPYSPLISLLPFPIAWPLMWGSFSHPKTVDLYTSQEPACLWPR